MGGAVGEGPDGRVPGPNGPRSWARTTRGEGGPLGPSGTGLGGPRGPPQMPLRGNNVSSWGHLARPRRRPRCATRGQATNRDCPPPPSAENEVRLDPNGAQVPELYAALDIGHRRACRKTPQTVQSILELVWGARRALPWGGDGWAGGEVRAGHAEGRRAGGARLDAAHQGCVRHALSLPLVPGVLWLL